MVVIVLGRGSGGGWVGDGKVVFDDIRKKLK